MNTFSLLSILFLLISGGALCGQTFEKHLEEALKCYQAKKYIQARDHLKKADTAVLKNIISQSDISGTYEQIRGTSKIKKIILPEIKSDRFTVTLVNDQAHAVRCECEYIDNEITGRHIVGFFIRPQNDKGQIIFTYAGHTDVFQKAPPDGKKTTSVIDLLDNKKPKTKSPTSGDTEKKNSGNTGNAEKISKPKTGDTEKKESNPDGK